MADAVNAVAPPTAEDAKPPAGPSVVQRTGGVLWLITEYGWILLPISMLAIGWGVGQTLFPGIHTRVLEWGADGYPVFNRLPYGSALGMGILVVLGGAWAWRLHVNTRDDEATAKDLKRHCYISVWILSALLVTLGWKISKGTLSYWFIPSLLVAFIAVFLTVGNTIHTLAGRDMRRGAKTSKD